MSDLQGVDLNLLVAFEVLMAERSVSAAAERLSVGQPAMSATLSRLRKLLDDPLLVREGREMQPTAFALSLVEPVSAALDLLRRVLETSLRFEPASAEQSFTIMASDHATLAIVHPLLRRIARDAPKVTLNLAPVSADFARRVRSGNIDLAILPSEVIPRSADVSALEIYAERYVVAVDQDHPIINASTITVDQLRTLPYLACTYENSPALVDQQLESLGIQPRVEATTSFAVAPYLLRGTPLIAMLPATYAGRIAAGAGIRLLEPPVPIRPVTESLVWNRSRTESPGLRWLRELVIEQASSGPGAST